MTQQEIIDYILPTLFCNITKSKVNFICRPALRLICLTISIVAGIILLTKLETQRRDAIFQSHPKQHTVAVIERLETSRHKNGTFYEAIVKFDADGKTMTLPVSNNDHRYAIGQRYEVMYVIDYPELFGIVRRIE